MPRLPSLLLLLTAACSSTLPAPEEPTQYRSSDAFFRLTLQSNQVTGFGGRTHYVFPGEIQSTAAASFDLAGEAHTPLGTTLEARLSGTMMRKGQELLIRIDLRDDTGAWQEGEPATLIRAGTE